MSKIYKCTATYNNDIILLGYTKNPNIMREYYINNGHTDTALNFEQINIKDVELYSDTDKRFYCNE